mmetsp:Transcript_8701/g.13448  ORF Transcript_8701/g.13448 Transcript_8701/m.13448 type:complete len:182 (+) Transcript_8701:76-621(+)
MKSLCIFLVAFIPVTTGFSRTHNLKPLVRALPTRKVPFVLQGASDDGKSVALLEKPQVESDVSLAEPADVTEGDTEEEEKNLMQKVKDAGTAGIISYALWEFGFWFLSVPVCLVGYRQVTGHWPDLKDSEDLKKLGAEAFAFVNFARFAVPLRIGLALSTTPWIQTNLVDKFFKKEGEEQD